MKLLRRSVLLLAGLTAVARAEPSAEASLAVKADLAKARAALARHDTRAVVEELCGNLGDGVIRRRFVRACR